MTHLFQGNRVKLFCSCGILKPITAVYFCRYCLKLRCGNCISHEIDTLYCPNCLENMPSTEARLKKNRCANCFDCPSCGHTLLSRTSSIQVPSAEDPNVKVAKKVYYLSCTSCRWTSRDVGIQDQTVATGGWVERDHPEASRIQELLEHFRALAQKEKFENERKKNAKRRTSYLNWKEMQTSLTSGLSLTRKSLPSSLSLKGESSFISEIVPSEPVEDVPQLPPEVFTEPLNICSVTTMDQRLMTPEWQPESAKELFPLHKHLLMKKSQRCRGCEHILSKPEYNPCSIKFKIQLGAYFHVPEIRIVKEVPLVAGRPSKLELSICNPTAHDMPIQLLPFSDLPADLEPKVDADDDQKSSLDPVSLTGLHSDKLSDILDVAPTFDPTCDVSLPDGRFVVAGKDETLEYGETDAAANYEDDPKVVAWRRANKVGVNVTITPMEGNNAVFAFLIRYDYKNTVATISSVRTVTLTIPVVVEAGKVGE